MRSVFFSQSEANEGWAMNGEIKIQFGDGTENLYGRGTLLLTMARERQPLYPARIVAARVNNALTDLQVGQGIIHPGRHDPCRIKRLPLPCHRQQQRATSVQVFRSVAELNFDFAVHRPSLVGFALRKEDGPQAIRLLL